MPARASYAPSTANVLPSGSLNQATLPPPALGEIPFSSVVTLVMLEGHAVGAELVDNALDIVHVPGGQSRGRLAGVRGRRVDMQRGVASPRHVGDRDRRVELVA